MDQRSRSPERLEGHNHGSSEHTQRDYDVLKAEFEANHRADLNSYQKLRYDKNLNKRQPTEAEHAAVAAYVRLQRMRDGGASNRAINKKARQEAKEVRDIFDAQGYHMKAYDRQTLGPIVKDIRARTKQNPSLGGSSEMDREGLRELVTRSEAQGGRLTLEDWLLVEANARHRTIDQAEEVARRQAQARENAQKQSKKGGAEF